MLGAWVSRVLSSKTPVGQLTFKDRSLRHCLLLRRRALLSSQALILIDETLFGRDCFKPACRGCNMSLFACRAARMVLLPRSNQNAAPARPHLNISGCRRSFDR